MGSGRSFCHYGASWQDGVQETRHILSAILFLVKRKVTHVTMEIDFDGPAQGVCLFYVLRSRITSCNGVNAADSRRAESDDQRRLSLGHLKEKVLRSPVVSNRAFRGGSQLYLQGLSVSRERGGRNQCP